LDFYILLVLVRYLFIINCSFYKQVATSFHTIFWKHVTAKAKAIEPMTIYTSTER